jgi:riboflavin-specific deaminase-like protein
LRVADSTSIDWADRLQQSRRVSFERDPSKRGDDLTGLSIEHAHAVIEARYAPLWAPLVDRPQVIGQLGQSLDGRIATATGQSHYVTGAADRAHLHRLRALSDAVVIGANTLVADNPQLTVRAVEGPNPVRVVVASRPSLPADREIFNDGAAPTWQVGPRGVGDQAVDRWFVPASLTPALILAELAQAGIQRVLIEGGARTLSMWLAAGLIDYLYLTIAPVIIGAGPTGLQLPPIDHMDQALRPAVESFALGADRLYRLDFSAEAKQ